MVDPLLAEALRTGVVSQREMLAVTVHAVGGHRVQASRYEIALLAWTAPWRGLRALAHRLGSATGRVPMVGAAWRLRWLVGAVCVVQSIVEGRAAFGFIGGMFIALTYLVPAASRAIDRRVEEAGDAAVLGEDLGEVYVGLLRRVGVSMSADREDRLQPPSKGTEPTARPALYLVRS